MKRKIIQIAAFGYSNAHLLNYKGGKIYQGKWKRFCNPGLNCYSCPAAGFACPIGALQAVNGSMEFQFSFYVAGVLLAFGVLLGRAVCGWLCPFGLIQELIHRIPSPKLKLKKVFLYLKYLVLVVFVLVLPVTVTNYMGMGKPAFCQYICAGRDPAAQYARGAAADDRRPFFAENGNIDPDGRGLHLHISVFLPHALSARGYLRHHEQGQPVPSGSG